MGADSNFALLTHSFSQMARVKLAVCPLFDKYRQIPYGGDEYPQMSLAKPPSKPLVRTTTLGIIIPTWKTNATRFRGFAEKSV